MSKRTLTISTLFAMVLGALLAWALSSLPEDGHPGTKPGGQAGGAK